MSKSFEIQLREKGEELVTRAQKTAQQEGLHFEGDTESGNIAGMGFEGTYVVEERKILVTIHKKPYLIPWFLVESTIRDFLTSDSNQKS